MKECKMKDAFGFLCHKFDFKKINTSNTSNTLKQGAQSDSAPYEPQVIGSSTN